MFRFEDYQTGKGLARRSRKMTQKAESGGFTEGREGNEGEAVMVES
ncbi:MAG: hypothetical protein JWR69_2083 [Pedosphaera sp.]|nr:hypothetical protein [Pedosphaera sp.]